MAKFFDNKIFKFHVFNLPLRVEYVSMVMTETKLHKDLIFIYTDLI